MANSDWYSPDLSVMEDPNYYHTSTEIVTPPDSSPTQEIHEHDLLIPLFARENCSLPLPIWPVSGGDEGHPWLSYRTLTAAVCGLYSAFGLLCVFVGYRCFKAVMFFTGFIFASIIVYLICTEDKNILPMWGNVLIACSAGVLFGLITLLVQYVGLFMLGFHTGLFGAVIGLGCADLVADVNPGSPWTSLGILLSCGLAWALLNLYFQKSLTIFGSALYGGAILATTADYFLENSIMLLWVWDKVRVKRDIEPCWFSWIILAVWPASFFLGLIVQCCCTGKGTFHERQFPSYQQQRRPKSETREERRQRKYRYLYQVRTCHGDVISQPIPGKYIREVNEQTASNQPQP